MITIPRKIYYEKNTGIVLLDTGEATAYGLRKTTKEEDFALYNELKNKNPDAVDFIELEIGQFADEFVQSESFSVDVTTKDILFLYPEEKLYEPSLFDKVGLLEEENQMLGMEQSEREIQQIILGQQLAEFEIRLLMGGM